MALVQTLDQAGDTNLQDLHRYRKLYGLPDFAKQADFNEDVVCRDSKATLYADPREPRQFPMHTKAATYVSYMYFLEKQSEVNPKVRDTIQSRLDKAAAYWGIKNDVLELQSKHAAHNKEAYPDDCYAIVWANSSGQKERHYPLRNALEVKAAAIWYRTNEGDIRKEYAFTDRAKIASKILKKAEDFGAAVPAEETELLEQACGRGYCDPTKAAAMIRNRAKAASYMRPGMKALMDKLAEKVANQPKMLLDPASTSQLATVIDEFDRTHNLVDKYSANIPSPESVLFEATVSTLDKIASESTTTLTGSVYTSDQFDKLSAGDVRGVFGDQIASQVCSGLKVDPEKIAELVSTLPRPDAVMFDDLMAEKGVSPIAKDASRSGFNFSELQALATS